MLYIPQQIFKHANSAALPHDYPVVAVGVDTGKSTFQINLPPRDDNIGDLLDKREQTAELFQIGNVQGELHLRFVMLTQGIDTGNIDFSRAYNSLISRNKPCLS